jgi:hypothetical protein
MAIMRVLVVELLCQVVTGHIPTLECLLLDVSGRLWLRLVISGLKWPRYVRILARGSLAQY